MAPGNVVHNTYSNGGKTNLPCHPREAPAAAPPARCANAENVHTKTGRRHGIGAAALYIESIHPLFGANALISSESLSDEEDVLTPYSM
jgi:hypothetical protein